MAMVNKPLAEIRAEFDQIDKSNPSQDWNWCTKIDTWEEFLKKGEIVANLLRANYTYYRKCDKKTADERYEHNFRSINPKFHDWVMKIFPKD